MVLEFLDTVVFENVTVWSLIVSAIIMATGVIVARIVRMIFYRKFAYKMEEATAKNLGKGIYFGIIAITLIAVTTSQGIDLAGLVVAGGFLGIVIGFAAQSVVSNLISGLFLIIEKPLKQGENIEIPNENILGKVLEITTFSTRIQKFDGTVIRVPNSTIFTSILRSFSLSPVRRTEFDVGIAYKEDIDKAISVIKNAIKEKLPYSLLEPEPAIWVTALADSSVNLKVLIWHPRDDIGEIFPVGYKIIKQALDKEGIEIPFPQKVVWKGDEN